MARYAILAAVTLVLIYLHTIESADRNKRDKAFARLGITIRGVLAHFADQTLGARRRCAYHPSAGEAACALPACPH